VKTVARAFLRYLARRRSLTLLQLAGIACGVAAVVGMTLSARSALFSFDQAVEFLRGKATHLIERPAGAIEEKIVTDLMGDPAVQAFSPVIDRRLRLANDEPVRLLGIDPFLDRTIRPALARIDGGPAEGERIDRLVRFLVEEKGVLVDSRLAADLPVRAGERFSTSQGAFDVLGTFPNPSGEHVIVMDIAHAQELFNMRGRVDRVDLIVGDEESFRSRWGKGFLVESNSDRRQTFAALLRAFKLNLQALSLLALFVGVFLIYNTSMFAVVSRRRDAGILVSLGAQRHEIVASFLLEVLILGIIGGGIGGFLGYLLSMLLTGLVGNTISAIYFFLRPEPLPWSFWNVAAGIVLGCGAGLLGSIEPLLELVRVEPVKALRGRTAYRGGSGKAVRVAIWGTGIVLLSIALLALSFVHVYVGFAGAFVFLLGVSLFTAVTVIILAVPLKRFFHLIGGLAGRVAMANIRLSLGRTSVAVAAFMVALSMSIGLGLMIDSFRQSLIWWMNSQLRGDFYISTKGDVEVPEEFYREIAAMPGIGGVDPFRNVQVAYDGKPAFVTAISAHVLQRFARFGWVRGGDENWDPVKSGAVIVSESFARRFRIKAGESVTLEGRKGPVRLRVAAVFYDYTTEHGLIMMDRATYLAIYDDRTINSLGVFIDPDAKDRGAIITEIRKKAGERNLPVVTREQLYGNILSVFDSTFAVTRSMRILAIVVAFFGIAGALMTLFVERQKDFGIYRALGFSTPQIAAMTVIEGLGMGIMSLLMSTVVGTGLAAILIKVINLQSFNWTIFFHLSAAPFLTTAATALAASLAASFYPLWRVFRTYPQMQIREE
jgi:putative ABC transport system permease protein